VGWRRLLLAAGALIVAVPIGYGIVRRPDLAIRSGTSGAADQLCAKTFVAKLDPEESFAEILEQPGIGRLRRVLRHHVDRVTGTVDVSAAGLLASHAVFHEGFGCVLVHDEKAPYLPKVDLIALKTPKAPPLLPEIAGPNLVEPPEPALKAALDHAFEERASPPFRHTKAVVVVRDGKVIAERYAPGVGVDTPLQSFSMTKSLVNALLGIMTEQGLTSPSLPAPIPEWHSAGDPRREIEVGHLMKMTSGLALDEDNSGFDTTSQMFLHDDMAGFAVKAPLIAAPGTRFAYSSATTQILARIIRDGLGGPEQTLRFAWNELFNPLGMRSVTLEFDGVGTLQGSSWMMASARDWAKFGLLYLHDGEVGGRRILHEDWVDFCAAATLDTDYAAGFWTNRSEHPNAKARIQLGIPRDAFFASGDLGQRVLIMPSQRLVVVRLGDSIDPSGDMRGLAQLVKEVISATGH
jgi:CubicO group peptidase (beta-lactamase class C family)